MVLLYTCAYAYASDVQQIYIYIYMYPREAAKLRSYALTQMRTLLHQRKGVVDNTDDSQPSEGVVSII